MGVFFCALLKNCTCYFGEVCAEEIILGLVVCFSWKERAKLVGLTFADLFCIFIGVIFEIFGVANGTFCCELDVTEFSPGLS